LNETSDNRARIERMRDEGKISPEEAKELLDALDNPDSESETLLWGDVESRDTPPPSATPPGRLDMGRALNEGWELYTRNFWTLFGANLLWVFMSVVSFSLLMGPGLGGVIRLNAKALRNPDRHAVFSDFWEGFHRSIGLAVAFYLCVIVCAIGFVCLLIPGIIAFVYLMYTLHFISLRLYSAGDAVSASMNMVKQTGFVGKLILFLLLVALGTLTRFVPWMGLGVLLVFPVLHGILASAFLQTAGGAIEPIPGRDAPPFEDFRETEEANTEFPMPK
jgi:hypothetical protein